MAQNPTTVTRENLAVLLTAKDAAKKAMSAAYATCAAAAADHTPEARLSLDLDRQRALNAYCRAEMIYDAAVRDFLVNENH